MSIGTEPRELYEWSAHASGTAIARHLVKMHKAPELVVEHLHDVGRMALAGFHLADHEHPVWVRVADHAH